MKDTREHFPKITKVGITVVIYEDKNIGNNPILIHCIELCSCLLDVPREPIENRIRAAATGYLARRSGGKLLF